LSSRPPPLAMLRRIEFLLDRLNRYFRQRRAALSQPKLALDGDCVPQHWRDMAVWMDRRKRGSEGLDQRYTVSRRLRAKRMEGAHMKDLHELLILLGMYVAMFMTSKLLDRYFKSPDDADIYTLSDTKGNGVQIVISKQATAEEREKIFNEKIRELIQQQPATKSQST
jgi:hypothetical protein